MEHTISCKPDQQKGTMGGFVHLLWVDKAQVDVDAHKIGQITNILSFIHRWGLYNPPHPVAIVTQTAADNSEEHHAWDHIDVNVSEGRHCLVPQLTCKMFPVVHFHCCCGIPSPGLQMSLIMRWTSIRMAESRTQLSFIDPSCSSSGDTTFPLAVWRTAPATLVTTSAASSVADVVHCQRILAMVGSSLVDLVLST